MIKLQSGYTTWEQGKILLKLGVPKDSADLYWISRTSTEPVLILNDSVFSTWEAAHKRLDNKCAIKPCWSVGRLMEIIDICEIDQKDEQYPTTKMIKDETKMDYIDYLVGTVRMMLPRLDFSKLEEE